MIKPFSGQIIAELQAEGCAFRLFVNGINIAAFADTSAEAYFSKLNVWLRRGRNNVVAEFPLAEARDGSPMSRLILMRMSDGRAPVVLSDSGNSAGASVSFSVDIADATGSAIELLEPTALSPNDTSRIVAVTRELHRALATRDFDRVIELQRLQLEEKAVAVDLSPDKAISDYLIFLNEVAAAEDFLVAPFEATVHTTALPGLFHVLDRSGAPAIRARTQEMRFAIDPYVARHAGQWKIVR